MKTISRFLVVILVITASGSASASECAANYKASGSYRQGKMYTTHADFPGLEPGVALRNLVTHFTAEGMEIQSTDEAAGTLSALAKTGNKTSPVEVRTEAIEGGTRVHFSIDLPSGFFANSATKATVCRFVELARVEPGQRYEHELVSYVRTHTANKDKVGVVESNAKKRVAKVALGALGGAVLGALHASVTGGDVAKEAAVGAMAGGLVTFAVTKIQDKRLANRDAVMQAQGYDPAQGYRTGVRSVTVTPVIVKPGGKITVVTTYWALAPAASDTFGVHRYAGLRFTGDIVRGFRFSPEPFQFDEGGGEYQTTIELEIPAAADPGPYSVQWVVDGQSTGAEDSASFRIAG